MLGFVLINSTYKELQFYKKHCCTTRVEATVVTIALFIHLFEILPILKIDWL
jgi:hypothetical protein